MNILRPSFDVSSGTWYDEESDVEATTLRELIKKLPPRTKIADYYPKGDFRAPPWPKTASRAKRIQAPVTKARDEPLLMVGPPAASIEVEERVNAVLDAWAANAETEKIVADHGLGGTDDLLAIVREARGLDDPRASAERTSARKRAGRALGEGRKYDHDIILDMWHHGATASAIENSLGIRSKGAVASILASARRRGDGRAARRGWKSDKGQNRNKS